MPSDLGGRVPARLAVVTPTLNRQGLLERLYASLSQQTDTHFTWVIVDDGSDDSTATWGEGLAEIAPFPVITVVNERNVGKCASLTRGFDATEADIYLVVDSDDLLLPGAIATVKLKWERSRKLGNVGCLFFCYRGADGASLGSPPGEVDVVMSRAEMDAKHGKYDGCVAYARSMLNEFRYPEFCGETYLGPTVIQMMMDPSFRMLFCADVIGIAEYQADGLSRSGRALRLRNPRGMMFYSKVCAMSGQTRKQEIKYRVSYWAYHHLLAAPLSPDEEHLLFPPRGARWERWAGRLLLTYWRREVST